MPSHKHSKRVIVLNNDKTKTYTFKRKLDRISSVSLKQSSVKLYTHTYQINDSSNAIWFSVEEKCADM